MRTIKTIFTSIMILASLGVFAQEMKVDTKKSSIKWHGEKVTGEHSGTIQIEEGWLAWENNKITDGSFVIDMTSIKNTDIEDTDYRKKLEGHLKSDDFFGVSTYPDATLKITGSNVFKNNKATVKGQLTIKGISHPIEFNSQKEGEMFLAEIVVDRSKYDVRYGSGSFFDNLGDKMIYDDFTLTVKLVLLDDNTASM